MCLCVCLSVWVCKCVFVCVWREYMRAWVRVKLLSATACYLNRNLGWDTCLNRVFCSLHLPVHASICTHMHMHSHPTTWWLPRSSRPHAIVHALHFVAQSHATHVRIQPAGQLDARCIRHLWICEPDWMLAECWMFIWCEWAILRS